jgi:hypothetical protein
MIKNMHRGVSRVVGLCGMLLCGGLTVLLAQSAGSNKREALGRYFAKKQYSPVPQPKFALSRDQLPSPIYAANPLWVQVY